MLLFRVKSASHISSLLKDSQEHNVFSSTLVFDAPVCGPVIAGISMAAALDGHSDGIFLSEPK